MKKLICAILLVAIVFSMTGCIAVSYISSSTTGSKRSNLRFTTTVTTTEIDSVKTL